jgi:hypothetical protein
MKKIVGFVFAAALAVGCAHSKTAGGTTTGPGPASKPATSTSMDDCMKNAKDDAAMQKCHEMGGDDTGKAMPHPCG